MCVGGPVFASVGSGNIISACEGMGISCCVSSGEADSV